MSISIAGPKATTYAEKLLPNQKFGMHWSEDKENFTKLLYDEMTILSDFDSFNGSLIIEKPAGIEPELMTTAPAGLSFLQLLIRQKQATNVLEIGTFLGISAMFFAEAVRKQNGKVVTIELGKEFADIAARNFKQNNYENIEVVLGDAKEMIGKLPMKSFQFVFIDGDKIHYLELFLLLEKLVAKDCLIVFDDILFHGDILNDSPKTKHGRGVKKLLSHLKTNDGWNKTLVPILNGMLILERR